MAQTPPKMQTEWTATVTGFPGDCSAAYLSRIAAFVRSCSTLEGWEPHLLDLATIVEVRHLEELGAVVWYNFANAEHTLVETHAVSHPFARGRWLNKATLPLHWQVLETYRLAGCTEARAQLTGPLSRRIWRGLGYTLGDTHATKILEDPHGEDRRHLEHCRGGPW